MGTGLGGCAEGLGGMVDYKMSLWNFRDVPLEVRINGERINGFFHLLINGIYLGYNPFTNLLLTSWDIQVAFFFGRGMDSPTRTLF